MVSEPTTPTMEQVSVEEASLPYSTIDDSEFAHVRSGPRIFSLASHSICQPVTMRNYIAGHTKKALRLLTGKQTQVFPQVFLKLPVELQLHILEHLHPIDLYHFSQVSKSFRKLILDRKAAGVWEAVFRKHPELPNPPPRVAQSDWAFMLFGPGICGVCSNYGALTDFGFLKRFCESCMKNHYSFIGSFRDDVGNLIPSDHDIWTLLPRSYRYSEFCFVPPSRAIVTEHLIDGLRYTTAYANMTNAKFLKEDFPPMWKKLRLIHILVSNGVPHLPEVYQEYKIALADHIQKRHESATRANFWAVDFLRLCTDGYDGVLSQLTEKCKSRLQALGHDMMDITPVTNVIKTTLRQDAIYHMNSTIFHKIKPKLEMVVQNRREFRIKKEREGLLEGIYEDYLKTRPPDSWQYLPQPQSILKIEAFKEFLEAPCDKRGDIAPGYAVTFFPPFIESFTRTQQEEIVNLFPTVEGTEETFEVKFQRLELATSVATCTDCRYKCHYGHALVGWKDICRHKRSIVSGYESPCGTYEFNGNAVAAAASLVSCVGLDPSTTTVDDMNRRDDRFVCGNCMPVDHRGIRGMKVYTWIECIQHAMYTVINNYPMHNTPAWLLLTPEATQFVREHEVPYPNPRSGVWGCNHCAHNFKNQARQADAICHVQRVHCIKEPVIGVDVVADLRLHLRKRRLFFLGRDPAFEHKCRHCHNLPIYKLWQKEALMKHLKNKHHINEPVEDRDWETIVVLAAR